MLNKYTIAFDVGGSFIKSAVLNEVGQVCDNSFAIYPSHAHESKAYILDYLVDLIRQQAGKIMDKFFRVEGIGYAFPGPFDYENGISYIRDVDKFESLYAVDVRAEILRRIRESHTMRSKMSPDVQVAFENDANLFALGESLIGKARGYRRSICFTIGTGIGSAFLEDGLLVKHRSDVPLDGWVFREPFRDSVVEDYISRRGILRLAQQSGVHPNLDVDEIASLASQGNEVASQVFMQFGEMLGEMIHTYVASFQPNAVVIGGQIAKSHVLFTPGIDKSLLQSEVKVEFVEDTSRSTFAGVAALLNRGLVNRNGNSQTVTAN